MVVGSRDEVVVGRRELMACDGGGGLGGRGCRRGRRLCDHLVVVAGRAAWLRLPRY